MFKNVFQLISIYFKNFICLNNLFSPKIRLKTVIFINI